MKTTFGPTRLAVVLDTDQGDGRGLEVWRIVRSDVPEDPVFVNSFASNFQLRRPARKVENAAAVIHMGVSMYLTSSAAHGTARRFAKLGDYVARLRLAPDRGFNYAFTGHKHHLTIWGDPVKLSEATVDIDPVEGA